MVKYKKAKYKEFTGEHQAVVSEVLVEENGYYNPEWENSTEEVLTIVFTLDFEGEPTPFTQRFVSPLTGGSGLFQQLLDAAGVSAEDEEGNVDEQAIVNCPVIVTIGKNSKGYDAVVGARVDLDAKKTSKKGVTDAETGEVFDS